MSHKFHIIILIFVFAAYSSVFALSSNENYPDDQQTNSFKRLINKFRQTLAERKPLHIELLVQQEIASHERHKEKSKNLYP